MMDMIDGHGTKYLLVIVTPISWANRVALSQWRDQLEHTHQQRLGLYKQYRFHVRNV